MPSPADTPEANRAIAEPAESAVPPGTAELDLRARAERWAEETTKAQGLPLKVSDPANIRYIAAILASGRAKNGRQA